MILLIGYSLCIYHFTYHKQSVIKSVWLFSVWSRWSDCVAVVFCFHLFVSRVILLKPSAHVYWMHLTCLFCVCVCERVLRELCVPVAFSQFVLFCFFFLLCSQEKSCQNLDSFMIGLDLFRVPYKYMRKQRANIKPKGNWNYYPRYQMYEMQTWLTGASHCSAMQRYTAYEKQ